MAAWPSTGIASASCAARPKPWAIRTWDMLTEAGHDAMHVANHLPTAMIFTPCEGGLSHNELENVTLADIEPGVNVLLQAVLARAA